MCEFNKLFFPKPSPPGYDYNLENLISLDGHRDNTTSSFFSSNKPHKIPCIEMKSPGAKYIMIYFHGNGEDL